MEKDPEFQEQYQFIKSDLKRLVTLNLLIVVLLIGLFFLDKYYHILAKLNNLF